MSTFCNSPLRLFLLNSDQHAAEIFPLLQKTIETFPIVIRPGGIAVSIIPHKTSVRVVQCHEMGAESGFFLPAVEEDAGIGFFGGLVKILPVNNHLHRKSLQPFHQTTRRPSGRTQHIPQKQHQQCFHSQTKSALPCYIHTLHRSHT